MNPDKYDYYHAMNEGGYNSCYDFTIKIFCQVVEIMVYLRMLGHLIAVWIRVN